MNWIEGHSIAEMASKIESGTNNRLRFVNEMIPSAPSKSDF